MADVVVVGGANLDVKAKTLSGHVARTSNPAAIVTKPGGVGRNIAHNLGRLGVDVALISVVGSDPAGEQVLSKTAEAGVDVSATLRTAKGTGTYMAILDNNGELITAVSDMQVMESLIVEALDWGAIARARFVVVDCNVSENVMLAISLRAGTKMVVEPVSVAKCMRLIQALPQGPVFLATPNVDQLKAMTGSADFVRGARSLHSQGLQNIVIHLGPEGAFVSDGKEQARVPVLSKSVIDVTGAGDAATAGLVAGLLGGKNLFDAAVLGQQIAARVVASHNSTLE